MNKLSPDRPIQHTGFTVGDFWAWAYSDILSNANRSVFAEFLVASALGVIDQPRVEWNAYDLIYKNRPVEMKTSAYLQSWSQKSLSKIRFDIEQKLAWDAATNTSSVTRLRSAHIYIFCLFAEQDQSIVDVLDTTKWQFYVLLTRDLERKFPQQKSLSLSALEQLCKAVPYRELKSVLDNLILQLDSGNGN